MSQTPATFPETDATISPAVGPPVEPSQRSVAAYAILAAGMLLWISALPGIPHAPQTTYGLLFAASPAFTASMAVLLGGFVVALRRSDHLAMGLLLLAAIAVQRLTVTLTTDVPIYSWTYKHLGVVDYIASHGGLARGIDVYNEWPGLFSATAWFSQITGTDPVNLAHWFTPVVHLLTAGAMIGLTSALGLSRSTSLTATLIVELLNWTGQDYFAPQAVALVLAISILALLAASRNSRAAAVLTVPLFAALTVSHQLTPYWLILASVLIAILGCLRPSWLPAVFVVIAVAYLYPRLYATHEIGLINSFNPLANASTNMTTIGTPGRQFTTTLSRILAVTLWILTAFSAVLSRRWRIPVRFPLAVLGGAFSLLFMNHYGGEAIIRVYLYGLPGCALIVAPVLVHALRARTVTIADVTPLLVAAALVSMQGYFGPWYVNLVRPTELNVARSLQTQVQPPANITMAAPLWPTRVVGHYADFVRYNGNFDAPMVPAAGLMGSSFDDPRDLGKVDNLMISRAGIPNYIVISAQMKRYCDYYGIFPVGALDRLRALMMDSPRWRVVYDSPDATVFLFQGPGAPHGNTVLTTLK